MKSTTAATVAYVTPQCRAMEIDSRELICASTERYSVNPNGPREDDWE